MNDITKIETLDSLEVLRRKFPKNNIERDSYERNIVGLLDIQDDINTILIFYPKLSDDEKEEIRRTKTFEHTYIYNNEVVFAYKMDKEFLEVFVKD